MTREALLQKAKEWLKNKGVAPVSLPIHTSGPISLDGMSAPLPGLLADFCLSELAARDLEIEKLRKDKDEKERLQRVMLAIREAKTVQSARNIARAALQREGPEGKP